MGKCAFSSFSFHQDKGERKSSFLQMGRGVDSNMGGGREGKKRKKEKKKKHYEENTLCKIFFWEIAGSVAP